MSEVNTNNTNDRSVARTKVGIVVSDKRDKTRTISVDYQIRHPKYGKYLKRQAKYHVHDEKNESKNGDQVEIASCRPISKHKSWRMTRVLEVAPAAVEHKQDILEDEE